MQYIQQGDEFGGTTQCSVMKPQYAVYSLCTLYYIKQGDEFGNSVLFNRHTMKRGYSVLQCKPQYAMYSLCTLYHTHKGKGATQCSHLNLNTQCTVYVLFIMHTRGKGLLSAHI